MYASAYGGSAGSPVDQMNGFDLALGRQQPHRPDSSMRHDLACLFNREAARTRPIGMIEKIFPGEDFWTEGIEARLGMKRLEQKLSEMLSLGCRHRHKFECHRLACSEMRDSCVSTRLLRGHARAAPLRL